MPASPGLERVRLGYGASSGSRPDEPLGSREARRAAIGRRSRTAAAWHSPLNGGWSSRSCRRACPRSRSHTSRRTTSRMTRSPTGTCASPTGSRWNGAIWARSSSASSPSSAVRRWRSRSRRWRVSRSTDAGTSSRPRSFHSFSAGQSSSTSGSSSPFTGPGQRSRSSRSTPIRSRAVTRWSRPRPTARWLHRLGIRTIAATARAPRRRHDAVRRSHLLQPPVSRRPLSVGCSRRRRGRAVLALGLGGGHHGVARAPGASVRRLTCRPSRTSHHAVVDPLA